MPDDREEVADRILAGMRRSSDDVLWNASMSDWLDLLEDVSQIAVVLSISRPKEPNAKCAPYTCDIRCQKWQRATPPQV